MYDVRIEDVVGRPAGLTEKCVVREAGGHPLHLVTGSVRKEGFCVISKGDSQGRITVGKN